MSDLIGPEIFDGPPCPCPQGCEGCSTPGSDCVCQQLNSKD